MIFPVLQDFAAALAAMPSQHPRRRIVALLDEAIRRDMHFIDRHPTTLFQCLWNSCWWYDCPEAAKHYEPPARGWPASGPPWDQTGQKLFRMLERCYLDKEQATPAFPWARSLRPPPIPLGCARHILLLGHEDFVEAVAFSSDGSRLATGSADQTIRIWDTESWTTLAVCRGHESIVTSVVFAPDGKRLASGSWDGSVRIWDAKTGAELAILRKNGPRVKCLRYSPDGRLLACGSGEFDADYRHADEAIHLWDMGTDSEVRVITGIGKPINDLAWSPDGRHLAASYDFMYDEDREWVLVWDAATGSRVMGLKGHNNIVMGVAYKPDGRHLVTGAADGSVRIWDAQTGAFQAELGMHAVSHLSLSPDGRRVAVHSHNSGTIQLSDLDKKESHATLYPPARVHALAYSPNGCWIAAGCDNQSVVVWDAQTSGEPPVLIGHAHNERVLLLCYTPNGQRVLSSGVDGQLREWCAESGTTVDVIVDLMAHYTGKSIRALVCSPDGKRLAGDVGESIWVWDLATNKRLAEMDCPECSAWGLAFTSDTKRLVTALSDKTIRIWDANTGAQLTVLPQHGDGPEDGAEGALPGGITSIAISPDAKLIASTTHDHTVWLLNVETRKEVRQLAGHQQDLGEIAFSLDGQRVACRSANSMIVWDVETGQRLGVVKGRGNAQALANSITTFARSTLVYGTETAIIQATSEPAAWFPVALEPIVCHPSRPRFTGAAANHVYFLSLGGADGPAIESWFYSLDRRQISGPVTPVELRQLLESGNLPRDALVSRDRHKWYPASRIRGIRWPDG